jgi:hypothetical protein
MKRMRPAALAVLCAAAPGFAHTTERRTVQAVRTTTPIVLDGRLDEAAWELAEPATDFIGVQPYHGQPATEQTEIRLLYDADNLYIGAICYDSDPSGIRINTLQQDFTSNNTDLVAFVLDTLHDRQSGFSFWVNPAGARRETQIDQDGEWTDAEWEGVWNAQTSITDAGWIAEVVIPFKTLRFSSAGRQEWGFNAVRRTRRTNEDSTWAPLPLRINSITRISWAGTLAGLDGVRQGRNLKIKPFAIASAIQPGPGRGRDFEGDAGLDIKYGITPRLTLDATYRTDFSQVEADEEQVNLTRFNLFFPEKREFFLENQGLFEVAATPGDPANVIPFFSRRIGLSASGTPIPMLGGARMSGRAGGYDLGVVAMKTQKDDGLPSDNFVVGRIRRSLVNTSTIGAIFTSRDSTVANDFNRLVGVDTRLRFFDRRLDVVGYLMGTDSAGSRAPAQSRLLGAAWRDDRLTWAAQYEKVDPDFDPQVGFVRRTAMTHVDTEATWQQRTQSSWLRHYFFQGGADHYADPNGDVETRLQNVGVGVELQNGAQVEVGAQNTFDRLVEPFAIRPTVVLPIGDYEYLRYTLNANSDLSRAVSGTVSASAGEFWDGTSRSISGSVNLRPSHHLNVAATLNRNTAQLPSGDFSTTVVGARVFVGFNSNTFLSSFLQYNATTNQFSANTRFNLIHRPLSDLFVVYNERRDTATDGLIDRALVVKFTNLFEF